MSKPSSGALGRFAHVERSEVPALVWSFAFFFCVLAGYYVIRPVREEMDVRIGREWLQTLFVIVFFVMLVAVPLFGWVVSRFEKRRIEPIVYAFFIVCLHLVAALVLWCTVRICCRLLPLRLADKLHSILALGAGLDGILALAAPQLLVLR